MLKISGKILKSLIVDVDFESWNYCIPRRHRLVGQTTKQPLSNFEPKKSWKYKQLWELRDYISKKGPASLLKISLWGSFASACANESPDFSVSGAATPNGLFQKLSGLKRLVSYSKRLH